MFDSARQLLDNDALFTERIDFVRDGATIAGNIRAKVGRRIFKLSDGVETFIVRARRFIVRTADIQTQPKMNDTIHWRGRRYRIYNPDGGPVSEEHMEGQVSFFAVDAGEAR